MILYIGNNVKSSNVTVMAQLSQLLRKEGYTVTVSSSKENQFLRLFEMLFSVLKWSKQVDYVLIDTYSTKNFYYAFLVSQLCRVLKLKYIPILHGGKLPTRLKSSPGLAKMIFNHSYINIAPSYYLKEAFEKENFSVKFIPNNIEVCKYELKKRMLFKPNLLFVRSFSKIYNPQLAIQVLQELKKDYPTASLCMVGPEKDGTLQECKELVNKLDLEDSVVFTGKLSKQAWHHLASEYDIFINPTDFDNTPISVIEAMALGLPVVSTNVGGMSYLIKNDIDGLLVEANNVLHMTNAVKSLIETPSKAIKIVEQARVKVEGFDWKEVKKEWLSVLAS
ncbi:glycosyltransferase family 4 protein [Pseudofulvibacter geojedonensis]|uniref:Glycosyltransferase family 4 protein n=1 Tax=Pseudofulvibacter geojedonensis TaxID=1123758 RepID=A0ABW3HYF0_9FLAO